MVPIELLLAQNQFCSGTIFGWIQLHSRFVLAMSFNLSRNASAMEKALRLLHDADYDLEECSSCLMREVIVSEARALD